MERREGPSLAAGHRIHGYRTDSCRPLLCRKGHAQHGDSSAGARGISVQGPPWLILVAIGVGLVVFSAIWDFGESEAAAAGGSTDESLPAAPTTAAPTTAAPTTATPVPPTPTTEAPTAAGCRVTISNPLATILETPEVFGQEVVRVPPGEYAVIAIEDTNFGGLQDQRWFQISVAGREGWLQDSTFDIAAKSPDCP